MSFNRPQLFMLQACTSHCIPIHHARLPLPRMLLVDGTTLHSQRQFLQGAAMNGPFQSLQYAGDALFLMIGAVLIFSMHAGFAFLEVGTVRKKNQVNALVKIISDWGVSTVMYFVIGFPHCLWHQFLDERRRPSAALQRQSGRRASAGSTFCIVSFCSLSPRAFPP